MKMEEHRYDDILYLPHHVSKTHPQMARMDRAAQFAPFAALTGHKEAVHETARLTENEVEQDETVKRMLDDKLHALLQAGDARPEVSITYFVPDEKKSGGAYQKVTGRVQKAETYRQILRMEDGTKIPVKYIVDIESDWFCQEFWVDFAEKVGYI